jgi:hypothetical protein
MIEAPDPGRVDLRPIEEGLRHDVDRIIGNAIRTGAMRRTRSRSGLFGELHAFARPLIAAAAVILILAATTLALADARLAPAPPDVVLADWARTNHVPTNGELLFAFEGYGR